MVRARATANSEWGVGKYRDVISSVFDASPGVMNQTLEAVYGPFVKDGDVVSSSALTRALPLAERFVYSGQSTAVIHGCRLEAALVEELSTRPHFMTSTQSVAQLAHSFTNHVVAIMKTIRAFVREEQPVDNARWTRRFPKTGGIRRRITPTEF